MTSSLFVTVLLLFFLTTNILATKHVDDDPEGYSVEGEDDNDPSKLKKWNGNHIAWITSWEDAKAKARRERKPILYLTYRESECPACDMLEATVAMSMDFEVMSEHFVMLMLGDMNTPDEEQFLALPAYSPRVYFLNYKGRILDVINEQGMFPDNLHFYLNADQLVVSMKEVLRDQKGFGTFRGI